MFLCISALPLNPVDGDNALYVDSLQHFFCPPMHELTRCLQLEKCCSTMVILVVWMCLRFGCHHPQVMVDSIRCAMWCKRSGLLGGDALAAELFTKYLLQLRAWQNGFVDINRNMQWWLRLRQPAGTRPCNYMVYRSDTEFFLCPALCENALPWCSMHASECHINPLNDPPPVTDVVVMLPPPGISEYHVAVAELGWFFKRVGGV